MLNRFYRIFNLLNLDVAAGAVVTALFYAKILSVPPRLYGMLTLGLAVWIIYTIDRLLDIRRLGTAPTSQRHRFHQQYEKSLWMAVAGAAILVLSQIYFLRSSVLLGGLYLSAAVGLYLFLQRFLRVKEMLVATLYTAGILVPSLSIYPGELSIFQYLLIAQLFVVALVNLLLFSWFEFESDQKDNQPSFATQWGKTSTARLIIALCVVNPLISILIAIQYQLTWLIIIFPFMTIVLLFIYLNSDFFYHRDRYRLLGDAVFFIPIFGLLL